MTAPGAIVHAVVVTYRPSAARLSTALRAVAPQVARILVMDNGGAADELRALVKRDEVANATVLPQQGNVGVAQAQNEGIRLAVESGADHVLLLDDDSVPAPDMVARLVEAVADAHRGGVMVAAAGPIYHEEHSARPSYFVRFGLLGIQRIYCAQADTTIPADFLISSGTLIPARAFSDIGLMDSALFIDHVDTEWCLRARARGYRILGVCGARMSHQLGGGFVALPGGRRVFKHGPFRRYFMFRNSILLYRRAGLPLRWKVADAARLVGLFASIVLFSATRLAELRAAFAGVAHGIRGRGGPAPEAIASASKDG